MNRPRLCAVCHVDATWVMQVVRRCATIKRDGTVKRGMEAVHTFYCDEHIP